MFSILPNNAAANSSAPTRTAFLPFPNQPAMPGVIREILRNQKSVNIIRADPDREATALSRQLRELPFHDSGNNPGR